MQKILSQEKIGTTFTILSLVKKYRKTHLSGYVSDETARSAVIHYLSIGKKAGILQKINKPGIPLWFIELETISYWQSQLRGSKFKNMTEKSTTKSLYLFHLWGFNKWLTGRLLSITQYEKTSNDTFVQKNIQRELKNVEDLLNTVSSFESAKKTVKIVKQYLLDEKHNHKKASYIHIMKSAILSYFEKNDCQLQLKFNPKIMYSTDEIQEQELSLSDFMQFLTTGKPNILEKTVFLCKFHTGLDAATFCDRFNFEVWEQILNWFGTEIYDAWDLEKCPVPILVTRIKTGFKHTCFLDRDSVESLQRFLKFREEQTGNKMNLHSPLFLNKFNRPVTRRWIFTQFSTIAKKSGIQKFSTNELGRKYFKVDSHELRDLLKSTLIDSGCKEYVADHVIGHKPKDSYEKQTKLYPETLRKEYAKASKRLNIFTKFTSVVNGTDDSDELRLELKEKLLELDRIKESRLDDEARQYRNEKAAIEHTRQMRILQDTVNELKKEMRGVRQNEKKPIEFCCISCSTVHDSQECPACGSKMKRIYEENI